MRVAVEDKNNNIKYFRFDGRQLNKFIEKTKKDKEIKINLKKIE